jgi:8-oxo-dGTP pyrophosphatase MutT (NUDIX family)
MPTLPETTKRAFSVAGGVVIDDGRALLLAVRERGDVRLPKGHIREGESREQAALREVIEETGYAHPVTVDCLGSISNEFDHGEEHVVRYETYFLMHLESPKLAQRDASDEARFAVRWVALEEAVGLLTYESEKEFMRRGIAFERTLAFGATSTDGRRER